MSYLNTVLDDIETNLKLRPNSYNQMYNNYLSNNSYNRYQNNNRNNMFKEDEARNIIKNEMYSYNPNYNNINSEMQIRINQMHNDIQNLKNNLYNSNRIREEMTELNNKIFKIEVDTSSLEKNVKNNEDLYKNTIIEEQNNNEKIINKYNEIEEKYDGLNQKLNIIKEEQNNAGYELMTSIINNNNYNDEITKLENKLNNFLNEQNMKFNNTLTEIYNNFIENTSNKEKEINLIKSNIKNTQEMLNNIKTILSPMNEIPSIKANINEIEEKMKDASIKYEEIVKDQEDMNLKNNELHQSLLNVNKDINEINISINQNQANINDVKNNYIVKSELKEINKKIDSINEEINLLQDNFEKNKKMLNKANKELNNINNDMNDIIIKDEFDLEIKKNQNNFEEFKNSSNNKIDEYNSNYNKLLDKFNQYNEEEINSMISINKQFKEISDKVNINNNEIKKLVAENDNLYNNFFQIKDKFKIIDKNIFNLHSLEMHNINNKKEIEIINEKVDKLEKDLLVDKNVINKNDELQLENIESLDKFNNKLSNENELRQNRYSDLIKETKNNEVSIENQINEINKNLEKNMNEIINKLNEYKNQQIKENEQNMKDLEKINKGISAQIEEFENIKRSIKGNNGNDNKKLLERRLDSLETEINGWFDFSIKMDELIQQNMEENNIKLEEINNKMNIFRQNVSNKLKETKQYIDTTLDSLAIN